MKVLIKFRRTEDSNAICEAYAKIGEVTHYSYANTWPEAEEFLIKRLKTDVFTDTPPPAKIVDIAIK